MTGRAAAVQGGLAALGLITAHLTWQREPERGPGQVTVIDASKSELQRLHYDDDQNTVDLWREGGTMWMHLVEKPKTLPPNADKSRPPPPSAPPRDLLGNEAATGLYDKFAPLVSPRAFGVLDAAKLKEIGLDPPRRKLVVTVKGAAHEFDVGQPEKAPSGEWFMRDRRDGRVYIMPRGIAPELQNPSHFMDRKLHTFEQIDISRIVVMSGKKQKEFVHVGKESVHTAGFAPVKTPDKRDQMVKNWHDAVWRIFAVEVYGKGETPSAGVPKPLVRVEYHDGGKSLGWIEIGRPDATTKTSEESPATTDAYARTEHTLNWVKLHSASGLIADADKILSGP